MPLFTAFYGSEDGASQRSGDVISPSIPTSPLPESPDMAVRYAEQVFWEVVGKLNKEVDSFWAPREDEDDDESEAFLTSRRLVPIVDFFVTVFLHK